MKRNLKITCMVPLLLIVLLAYSQQQPNSRVVINQNRNWQFVKDEKGVFNISDHQKQQWVNVNLPHTWNTADIMDDTPGYYRGVAYYKKTITLPAAVKNKKIFLCFEGVNQVAAVFINGHTAGTHRGGYTAFTIPVSPFIRSTDRYFEVIVKADNSYDKNIPPLSADFTFYGGIYRSVNLLAVSPVHFTVDEGASQPVMISTPQVSTQEASVTIKGHLDNFTAEDKKLQLLSIVYNEQGKKIAAQTSAFTVTANSNGQYEHSIPTVQQPHLWSPEDPYLYKVVSIIKDASTGSTLDVVTNTLGFRWFHFDAAKGFFLNGKNYKLIGTSRHQDYKGMGNAVSKALAGKDMELIKQTGANFFRVAHYPQDPYVMEVCDKIGLLTSVEIPVVNEITASDSFYNTCLQMQREMIRQQYNHPSIIIWCYMNEIFLRPHFNEDKTKQQQYFASIEQLARMLDSTTRKEDPTRYTMIANHADFNRYNQYHLTTIAQVTGWNLYSGWYGGKQEDFPAFLDRHHEQLPDQPFMITEYGADADNRIRSMQPVRFDKSVEYTTKFHQFYITEIMKRPFVAGAVVWNLADFNSETRTETMPHINNKGLLTWSRVPKDPYYLYEATLSKKPFIKISSTNWTIRGGIADSTGAFCKQPLQVASNLHEVEIWLNGKKIATAAVTNGLAECMVPFINGTNIVEAKAVENGKTYTDVVQLQFALQPYYLRDKKIPFTAMNILLGASRYFIDEQKKEIWMPDQPFEKGRWGHMGGKPFVIDNNGRLPYGTDKNIWGTDNDPIYQTQQTGIQAYCFDVPKGKYTLSLHFAELQGGTVKLPPYNLADSGRDEANVKRVFDVAVNGTVLLHHFDMMKEYGPVKAIVKTTTVTVKDDKGIAVEFTPVEGEPVLNAVQLKRIE
ncbi:MAG: glycoside hydrolase family 2 [Bacteroidetes bacterium]|nr:glycoside hydrolase family 2 [Bacteroidota bacterium]